MLRLPRAALRMTLAISALRADRVTCAYSPGTTDTDASPVSIRKVSVSRR